MATALAGGLLESGLATGEQIAASDPSAEGGERFASAVPGAKVSTSNAEVAEKSTVVILAVKPQVIPLVLEGLAPSIGHEQLVVSIAAGVTLSRLEQLLPSRTRVVRVMPNTPCLIGQGASGFSLGSAATEADGQLVDQMLRAVGIAFELPEPLLDGVTGLSGSGPAFVYTVVEALTAGGEAAGLPPEVAAELAAQTVAGAAEMILKTGLPPSELRDAVTSPGGTTLAGLEAYEKHEGRGALMAAVMAATERSRELGK